MLVRSWLEDSGVSEHTAWVAVEQRERDAQHFWLAVTNALAAALGGSVEPLGPTPGFVGRRWSNGCWRTFVCSKSRWCS